MRDGFRVAAAQLLSSPRTSLRKGLRACDDAKLLAADLLIFPEMWSNGYRCRTAPDGHTRFSGPAHRRDGDFVNAFREAAARLELGILITYLEAERGTLRNSATLIDRRGDVRLHYSKVHTCGFDEPERFLAPGDDLPVCDFDSSAGPVRIGVLICFDREFPEAARELSRRGAELLLIPNSCPLERHRLAQLDARAFENMAAICVANYPEPQANGHSLLLDGIAFDDAESSRDMTRFLGGDGEAILAGDIPLAALRTYRSQQPWGEPYQRSAFYSTLGKGRTEP